MAQIEKMIAKTFMDIETGLETGSFGARPKIAVNGLGIEDGDTVKMYGQHFDYYHE